MVTNRHASGRVVPGLDANQGVTVHLVETVTDGFVVHFSRARAAPNANDVSFEAAAAVPVRGAVCVCVCVCVCVFSCAAGVVVF